MASGTIRHDAPEYAESLIKLVYYKYTWTDSIASGASLSIPASSFGVSTPSGYRPMGIVMFTSGHNKCVVTQVNPNATGSTTLISIRNKHTAALKNHTAGVEIMYVRSTFCG